MTPQTFTYSLMTMLAAAMTAVGQEKLAVESRPILPIGREAKFMLANNAQEEANTVVSRDGLHIATVRQDLSRFFVTIDGVKSEPWDQVGRFDNSDRPKSTNGPYIIFSPAGDRVAYLARQGEQSFLVVGAEKTPIEPDGLTRPAGFFQFSLDGKRYAMRVLNRSQGKAWLVLDGKKNGPFGGIPQSIFSQSGKHAFIANTSYMAAEAGGSKVFLEENLIAAHSKVEDLRLSAAGDRFTFKALLADGWRVFSGGKQVGGRYAKIEHLQASTDGKRIVFVGAPTQDGVNSTGYQVVVDGKPGATYSNVQDLTLSPDSSRYAYIARKNFGGETRCIYVIDGKESRDYPNAVRQNAVTFSPDSKSVAFSMGATLVVDEKEYGASELRDGRIVRAGDTGPAFAFLTRSDDNIVRVIVNGVPGPPLASALLGDLSFSPDGTWAAYPARTVDNKFVVVAGDKTYALPGWELDVPNQRLGAHQISLSPRERHVVYSLGGQLFLDGVPGPKCYPSSNVTFSSNGTHVAALCGRSPYTMYVDGVAGPAIEEVFVGQGHRWQFGEDGRLTFTAVVGAAVQRLQIIPPASGLAAFSSSAPPERRTADLQPGSHGLESTYPGKAQPATPQSAPIPSSTIDVIEDLKQKAKSKLGGILRRPKNDKP